MRAVQNGLSHATVFAYGQTSSGKTHTMVGNVDDPGVTARAISDVFRNSKSQSVTASYVEIYNERIRDLLNPSDDLILRDDGAGHVHLVGVTQQPVRTEQDALAVLQHGQTTRRIAGTKMNAASSRSHAIFTLHFNQTGAELTLVDLAGSERATSADGARLQEGAHINQSLLVLGSIISRLSSTKSTSNVHLPFRDSKLTRLLRPALSGSGRTVVLCNVTPATAFFEESLSTLKFARRAKMLPVKPNIEPKPVDKVNYREKYDRVSQEVSILRQRFKALEQEVVMLRSSAGIALTPRQSFVSTIRTATTTETSLSMSANASAADAVQTNNTSIASSVICSSTYPPSSMTSNRADRSPSKSPRLSLCSSTETSHSVIESEESETEDFDEIGEVEDVDEDVVEIEPNGRGSEVEALRSRISFVERENERLKQRLLDMASSYRNMRLQATKLQSSVRIQKRKHTRGGNNMNYDMLQNQIPQTTTSTQNTSYSLNIHQHNHYHQNPHSEGTNNAVIERVTMSSAATTAGTLSMDPSVGSATALALHLGDLFTSRERKETNLGIAKIQRLQEEGKRADESEDGLFQSMVSMVRNFFQIFG